MRPRPYLAKLLLSEGLLSEAQLDGALALAEKHGLSVLEAVLQAGLVTDETMAQLLSAALSLPVASRRNKLLRPERGAGLSGAVPETFAREHALVALMSSAGELTVAMADPTDLLAIDSLRLRTGLEIKVFVAPRNEVLEAAREFYGDDKAAPMKASRRTRSTARCTPRPRRDPGRAFSCRCSPIFPRRPTRPAPRPSRLTATRRGAACPC